MIFIALMFISALSIAATAAYFSITGLVALFAASALAIIIMGTVLEAGKLVIVSYLYRYWPMIGIASRLLIMFFIAVLMAITSIGIFGFLSKAHLEHVGPQDTYQLEIEQIDKKIEMYQIKVDRNQSIINNLDTAFQEYIDRGFVTRGLEKRDEQSEQREIVEENIREYEDKIIDLETRKNEIRVKIQDIELEVGPIKYVAEMIYGDHEKGIEKAVKILILMLVCTFDPLAITLLISANHAFLNRKDKRVRSEFSILEGDREEPENSNSNNYVQNEKMYYDDLDDQEKKSKLDEVRDFLENNDGLDVDDVEPKEDVDGKYTKQEDEVSEREEPEVVEEPKSDNFEQAPEEKPTRKYFERPSWLPKKQ